MAIRDLRTAPDNTLLHADIAIVGGGGVALNNSQGNPWTANYLKISGQMEVDLRNNIAAEARAKITYENLINFTEDAGTIDALNFLMTREITHMKAFMLALDSMGLGPLSIGKLPPNPGGSRSRYWRSVVGLGLAVVRAGVSRPGVVGVAAGCRLTRAAVVFDLRRGRNGLGNAGASVCHRLGRVRMVLRILDLRRPRPLPMDRLWVILHRRHRVRHHDRRSAGRNRRHRRHGVCRNRHRHRRRGRRGRRGRHRRGGGLGRHRGRHRIRPHRRRGP